MNIRVHVGILALLAGLLVLAAACAGTGAAPTATSSAVGATPGPAGLTPTSEPTPESHPTVAAAGLVVGNTGGDGAFIRRTPGGDPLRAWPDGTEMVVVGAEASTQGRSWKNVRDPEGAEGWVASEFLLEP